MFVLCFIVTAFAGNAEIFKRTSFFAQPSSVSPNSLESKVVQLSSLEKEFQKFTVNLLEWGKKYHKFRTMLEKEMLLEILTHTGQSDFSKELSKCGVVDNVETEDMIVVKAICRSSRSSDDLVENLLKDIRTKAETCVNVKEKFKKKINQAYEAYFNSEVEDNEVKDSEEEVKDEEKTETFLPVESVAVLMQMMTEEKMFERIAEQKVKPLEELCKEYLDLSSNVVELTASSDKILSELF